MTAQIGTRATILSPGKLNPGQRRVTKLVFYNNVLFCSSVINLKFSIQTQSF